LKDTQQGHAGMQAAAAATSCVCMKIHSEKLTSTEISLLEIYTAQNIQSGIQAQIVTTYSLKATTTVIHYLTNQRLVRFATWEVVQQLPWFQQEHSVRTAGLLSTRDMWFPHVRPTRAAATCVGTRHRKWQLVQHNKTTWGSTRLKSSADHCHVPRSSLADSWPAWFVQSDESLDKEQMLQDWCYSNASSGDCGI